MPSVRQLEVGDIAVTVTGPDAGIEFPETVMSGISAPEIRAMSDEAHPERPLLTAVIARFAPTAVGQSVPPDVVSESPSAENESIGAMVFEIPARAAAICACIEVDNDDCVALLSPAGSAPMSLATVGTLGLFARSAYEPVVATGAKELVSAFPEISALRVGLHLQGVDICLIRNGHRRWGKGFFKRLASS